MNNNDERDYEEERANEAAYRAEAGRAARTGVNMSDPHDSAAHHMRMDLAMVVAHLSGAIDRLDSQQAKDEIGEAWAISLCERLQTALATVRAVRADVAAHDPTKKIHQLLGGVSALLSAKERKQP